MKVLIDEAQAERDAFHSCYGFFGGCSCHSMPPCGFCTHPGNPTNQEEDESCWREEPLQADRTNPWHVGLNDDRPCGHKDSSELYSLCR